MGRHTVYNNITSEEKIAQINPQNTELMEDFVEYLGSIGRAESTIKNYRSDLLVFFCWCVDNLENKSFVELTKREIARFQNYAIKTWGWSSNRLRTVKATLSSLGNYIEAILDDEYQGYRSIVRKVENPPKETVREKTIWSDEELEALLKKLVDMQEYDKACYIALGMYSGRRKAELCRFKVSDFDKKHLVCDGALYKSDPIRTKGRGNGKYIPCYTLAKKFKPYFDLWMKYRKEHGIESPWLFPNKTKPEEKMSISTVDGWTSRLTKLAGGKELYIHSLRHYFTTSLAKAGIPDSVIQTIVAWASADMVRVYDDSTADEQLGMYFKNGDIAVPESKSFGDI